MSAGDGPKMWGGRFDRAPDGSFYEFERSWHFDRRMLPQELALGVRTEGSNPARLGLAQAGPGADTDLRLARAHHCFSDGPR